MGCDTSPDEPGRFQQKRPPSIDFLLRQSESLSIPRLLRKRLIQDLLQHWRDSENIPEIASIEAAVRCHLEQFQNNNLHAVINATGVVLHTNLGRAPFHQDLCQHLMEHAVGYNNLELNLHTGKRGKRGMNVEKSLAVLAEAESATVVNNCAAALILILSTCKSPLCKEVIVSRSELVQIGGGFRIPEILETAGVQLREIGTTNRTSLNDYKQAINDQTALILKVHQSNFYMDGFVDAPSIAELSLLSKNHHIPFAVDLGSGALINTESHFSIEAEPTPASTLQQGASLVCFSGDKLMGGPQAGIIAGNSDWIIQLKSNPFFRALRADKLALSALEFTIQKHLESQDNPESPKLPDLPAYFLLKQSKEDLHRSAKRILSNITTSRVVPEIHETDAEIGGGTMPRTRLESIAINIWIQGIKPDVISRWFRECQPPIMGYVHQGQFRLNMRAVFPAQDEMIAASIQEIETTLMSRSQTES